jgi:hypothetical protein
MDPLTMMAIGGTAAQGIGAIASIFDTSEEDMFRQQMAFKRKQLGEEKRQFGLTHGLRERQFGVESRQGGIGILSGLRGEAMGMARRRNFRDALFRAGRGQ